MKAKRLTIRFRGRINDENKNWKISLGGLPIVKKRNLVVTWFFILTACAWIPTLVWAVPLSLDQNIKAILANRTGSEEGFDFVVIGDSRDGMDIYGRILNHAQALNPLFILNTGDFVKEGQAFEYENYKRQLALRKIPILHLPGNHDVRYGPENYRRYVGEANWYLDLGDVRLIGLDNAAGIFSEETVAFARKMLTDRKLCLVAFHIPPAIGRWAVHAMITDQQGGRGGEVLDLIKTAKVPMVFLGHIHLYDEMDLDGTRYIISAGGGAKLYEKFSFGKPEHGFVLVKVRPAGITHQWVALD
jgi:Icc-related predicted phosphoesterase